MTARFTFLFFLALPAVAFAHAFLDHADPAVGSSVAPPPTVVKIWFTQELEPTFSSIQVFDSNARQIDLKDSHPDSSDKKLLIVSVPALAPDVYRVVWSVVSTDTHHTNGDFKFTVTAGK